MVMNSLQLSDRKITPRNSRETHIDSKLTLSQQFLENLDTIDMVIQTYECVEYHQLHHGIYHVEKLGHMIAAHEVGPVCTPTEPEEILVQKLARFCPASSADFWSRTEIRGQLSCHILHELIPVLAVIKGLQKGPSLNNPSYVYPGLGVQRHPQKVRKLEEEGLKKQNNWHPLVIVDELSRPRLIGQLSVGNRDMVCVGDPAYLIGVVDVIAGEVCRAPTVDWVTGVLLGGDYDREYHHDEGCVAMGESVREVVVISQEAAIAERGKAQTTEELFHVRLKGVGIQWCSLRLFLR